MYLQKCRESGTFALINNCGVCAMRTCFDRVVPQIRCCARLHSPKLFRLALTPIKNEEKALLAKRVFLIFYFEHGGFAARI